MLRLFQRDASGNVAVVFAITGLLVAIAAGAAVDYSRASASRTELQSSVDAAALAGAREFITQGGEPVHVQQQSAQQVARQFLQAAMPARFAKAVSSQITADGNGKSVTVELDVPVETNFMQIVGIDKMPIRVTATAVADVRDDPLCILALDRQAGPGIHFFGSGDLDAGDCVVWSNSTAHRSVVAEGSGSVTAKRICTVGEFHENGPYMLKPAPEEHCQALADPLAAWTPPSPTACTNGVNTVSPGVVALDPGTYCSGLSLTADEIQFRPGIFVFKDGPLRLTSKTRITGTDVGIYLTGKDATMNIGGSAEIAITAAETGAMAGIAIAQDPASAAGGTSSLMGNVTLQIDGLLYFPTQVLSFSGNSNSAIDTADTAIVAKQIKIGGNSYLRVNIDRNRHDAFSSYVYASSTGVRLTR